MFIEMIHSMNIADFIFLFVFSIGVYWIVTRLFKIIEDHFFDE